MEGTNLGSKARYVLTFTDSTAIIDVQVGQWAMAYPDGWQPPFGVVVTELRTCFERMEDGAYIVDIPNKALFAARRADGMIWVVFADELVIRPSFRRCCTVLEDWAQVCQDRPDGITTCTWPDRDPRAARAVISGSGRGEKGHATMPFLIGLMAMLLLFTLFWYGYTYSLTEAAFAIQGWLGAGIPVVIGALLFTLGMIFGESDDGRN